MLETPYSLPLFTSIYVGACVSSIYMRSCVGAFLVCVCVCVCVCSKNSKNAAIFLQKWRIMHFQGDKLLRN